MISCLMSLLVPTWEQYYVYQCKSRACLVQHLFFRHSVFQHSVILGESSTLSVAISRYIVWHSFSIIYVLYSQPVKSVLGHFLKCVPFHGRPEHQHLEYGSLHPGPLSPCPQEPYTVKHVLVYLLQIYDLPKDIFHFRSPYNIALVLYNLTH